jgi:hypothetical protein
MGKYFEYSDFSKLFYDLCEVSVQVIEFQNNIERTENIIKFLKSDAVKHFNISPENRLDSLKKFQSLLKEFLDSKIKNDRDYLFLHSLFLDRILVLDESCLEMYAELFSKREADLRYNIDSLSRKDPSSSELDSMRILSDCYFKYIDAIYFMLEYRNKLNYGI